MMRIAQENPQSKEKILDAAQELMMAKGFVATTLDEICETSGVSKGSLFHYFKNKEDLGKATLERYCRRMMEMKKTTFCEIRSQESDPLKRIFKYVDFMIDMAQKGGAQGGCLVGTFAQEISQTHPELRSICQESFNQMSEALKEDLEAAKLKYKSKKSVNTQSLADFFVSIVQGSVILAKTHQKFDIMVENLNFFKQHLNYAFKREAKND